MVFGHFANLIELQTHGQIRLHNQVLFIYFLNKFEFVYRLLD